MTSQTDANPAIGFLRELIALGQSGERAVQARVAERLAALGCLIELVDYEPTDIVMKHEFASGDAMTKGQRRAVVGRLAGTGGGRSVILFAHPDSEPVMGTERWQHDPFAGLISANRLYGWGVADDLAGVAAMVAGLELALADGFRPGGDIVIASTPSKRHARAVTAVLQRMATPDAAIYIHPAESGAGLAEIKAFASGLLEFRMTVAGVQPKTAEPGHTAFAHLAHNPISGAMAVISTLQALAEGRAARIRHPRLQDTVGRSTNILVSSIRSGVANVHNRISEDCIIEGSVSFPPGEAMADVQAEIEAALLAMAYTPDAPRPQISWLSGVMGAETPADHPLYAAVSAAVRAETGKATFVNPMHTSSDIRVPIVQAGIPTVGLGPLCGDLTQNGRHDEWVDVDDYLASVRVVARMLRDWCGTKPTA